MMFLRFAIAAACAGVIVSRISLTASQVRWIEYVLFGSFTIILVITQYIGEHRFSPPGRYPRLRSRT